MPPPGERPDLDTPCANAPLLWSSFPMHVRTDDGRSTDSTNCAQQPASVGIRAPLENGKDSAARCGLFRTRCGSLRRVQSVECERGIFVDEKKQIRFDAQRPAHDSKRKWIERRGVVTGEQ